MTRKTYLFGIAACLLAAQIAVAASIRLATLNCYECFDPSVPHRGVAAEHPLSADAYARKIENLSGLLAGAEFIALQEVGGREEIEALARTTGMQWAFAKGRDTYTGEEVGVLYKLPGWKVTVQGRVGELDRVLSKHLVVTAENGPDRIEFLVVHMIRPLPKSAEKHQRQLDAIRDWMKAEVESRGASAVVVIGDTNHPDSERGSSIFGIGHEVADMTGFAPTHLRGQTYDRIAWLGAAAFVQPSISRPNYGPRPNDLQKHLWTDHFALSATLVTSAK